MSLIDANLRPYLEKLKGPMFEQNIPYMYVDTEKNITVGVGHNLSFHKDVLKCTFVVMRFERHSVLGGDTGTPIDVKSRIKDRKATNSEKQNDFNFLSKHTGLGHYGPDQLAKYTTLELLPTEIDALFESDLDDAFKIARYKFGSGFDKYPVTCKAALIDIAFNCGNFDAFYPNFVPAILGSGDFGKMTMAARWRVAAQNSSRGKVQKVRNEQIASWLNEGADSCE